jgi:2-dehydro-3-deoxygluconokinase
MIGDIVTFGESLLRLSPPDHLRLQQSRAFDAFYGGAEANVAVSLANFGLPVQYVTCLPDNELGAACRRSLRQHGVGTDFIEMRGDRIGLYFLEIGSGRRPSQVIYDRAHSSFATMDEETISWSRVFSQAGWFHWSGINPAVSAAAAKVTEKAVHSARNAGLVVSCDLNYRHGLWKWGLPPSQIMPNLVEECDVLMANTAHLMLGLPELPLGRNPDEAAEACSQLANIYPNLKQIAMTCREIGSTGDQHLTAVLWQAGQLYTSPTYSLNDIVDRVGAGDAFMAGLVFGLVSFPDDPQRIIDFAVACAVIKHTIKGDANLVSNKEIEQFIGAHHGFDIIR